MLVSLPLSYRKVYLDMAKEIKFDYSAKGEATSKRTETLIKMLGCDHSVLKKLTKKMSARGLEKMFRFEIAPVMYEMGIEERGLGKYTAKLEDFTVVKLCKGNSSRFKVVSKWSICRYKDKKIDCKIVYTDDWCDDLLDMIQDLTSSMYDEILDRIWSDNNKKNK